MDSRLFLPLMTRSRMGSPAVFWIYLASSFYLFCAVHVIYFLNIRYVPQAAPLTAAPGAGAPLTATPGASAKKSYSDPDDDHSII
ncbi:hypothetical protein LSTR_LSTR004157 [Laodelphax striatellus]|uniref:Uncharacterized protein n=1 Tax=Laodelphax striatellus TaxID=195883 RepID=A0A482X9K5_LAOST|nr:hypothetical protein LSTR_LSTR004157 [Laodelphax striatellus]